MNVLITGITGLLGTALVEENRNGYAISGIYIGNYKMANGRGIEYNMCDVTNREKLFKNFDKKNINCIIHTAGIANTDICEREPEKAYFSNVIGTKNMIDLARAKNAKLIYVSTNAVFDGKSAPYKETDEPIPVNQYGKIKLECERMIKSDFSNTYLIIRPILMYGLNNPNERKSFFTWILEELKNGEKINIVNDVYENPVLATHCAYCIWRLIDKDARGTYHIAGRDVLSRYEAAKLTAKVFSLDSKLINPVSSDFFSGIAPRPRNTSYITSKIERELGIKPLGLEKGLLMFKKRMMDKKGIL